MTFEDTFFEPSSSDSAEGGGDASQAQPDASAADGARGAQQRKRGLFRFEKPDPGEPRSIMLPWCAWLLASWSISLSLQSLMPSAQLMIMLIVIGYVLMWPALRLTQQFDNPHSKIPHRASRWSKLDVLSDWAGMGLILQVVIWPLQLSARWSSEQTLWLDGALASWGLLVSAVIAWGMIGAGGARRTWAMVVCVVLVFGEPLLLALVGALDGNGWTMRISPVHMFWDMSAVRDGGDLMQWKLQIISTTIAALAAWMVVVLSEPGREPHSPDETA